MDTKSPRGSTEHLPHSAWNLRDKPYTPRGEYDDAPRQQKTAPAAGDAGIPRKTAESAAKPATASASLMGVSPSFEFGHNGRFIDRLSSATRKKFPLTSGCLDYFPDALAAVSHISWVGNEKHNSGEPMHHARGKSMDHADCIVRHLSCRDRKDPAYQNDEVAEVFHLAEVAWRSLALLQERMELIYGLDMAPGAK